MTVSLKNGERLTDFSQSSYPVNAVAPKSNCLITANERGPYWIYEYESTSYKIPHLGKRSYSSRSTLVELHKVFKSVKQTRVEGCGSQFIVTICKNLVWRA